MHTRDKIKFFSVLINFVNVFSGIDETYKLYFSMFSSDINHLLRKSFSGNELNELHNKIVETLSVHEGLFGEAECLMVHHQLLHLARYIEQMGPLDSFWLYTSERAMGNLKNEAPKGGRNFIKTIIESFADWEQQRIRAAYDSKENNEATISNNDLSDQLYDKLFVKLNGGIIEHNDFSFSLFGRIKNNRSLTNSLSIGEFEMENLLKALVYEICKQFDNVNAALQTSSYYRLYIAYKEFHSKIIKTNSFTRFLITLNERNDEMVIKEFIITKTERSTSKFSRDLIVNEGKLYEEDLETALIVRDPFRTSYSKAIIYGKRFSALGWKYKESSDGKISNESERYGIQKSNRLFEPCNPLNNLTPDIFEGNLFASTLCCFKSGKECHNTKYSKQINYGNFVYFFRLFCPNDSVLNELPMCNLIPRKVSEDKYGNHYISAKDHYYEKNIFFVPLTNIYASAYLHSPPIINENEMIDYHELNKENMVNSKIYLIPLHPNFLYLKYEFESNKLYNGYENISKKNESRANINDELLVSNDD